MALSVRSGGRMFAAARASLAGFGYPDRWLITLRWIAAFGMAATTILGHLVVPSLPVGPLLVTVGAIVLSNMLWSLRVERDIEPNETVAAQLAGDVLSLSAVLWLSGGLTNPFAGFLTFQIVLAGLLGTRRTTVTVTGLAVAAAVALDFAPPLSFAGGRFGAAATAHVASVVSVAALGAFTGVFVFVYASRLEQLRQQAARAERLTGLGRTVAAMCHELNTPLGTILIAGKDVGLVGRQLGSSEVEELAETIADGARRASDIIGMMRGSIRPDARRENVELFGLVRRYVEQELERRGFRGARHIDCSGSVELPIVRAAVCQIISNLLANAVDATAAMDGAAISVVVVARAEAVDVTITDNGPGIDADLIGRIGEPFQTTKGDRGGTGLGLYVSSLLAERMGGALHLDTRAGRGTSATLTLTRDAARPVTSPRLVDSGPVAAVAGGAALP
jgi:two-component system sensor histidine kinase RegB